MQKPQAAQKEAGTNHYPFGKASGCGKAPVPTLRSTDRIVRYASRWCNTCCLLCVSVTHILLVSCCNSSLKWYLKHLRSLPIPLQLIKQALNVLFACTQQVSDLQELLLCKPLTFRQPQAPLTASAAVAVSSAMSGCILTTALEGSRQSSDQLSPAHAGHSGLPHKPPAQWRPPQAPKAQPSPQSQSLLLSSQEPHQGLACQQPKC